MSGPQDQISARDLLCRILKYTMKASDAESAAETLLQRYGSFIAVAAVPPKELELQIGIDARTARHIALIRETAILLMQSTLSGKVSLRNHPELINYLNAALAHERTEQFRVIYLDNKLRIIVDQLHGSGTVDHVPVYPREIVKRALELSASGIILVHNHPGGDPMPSIEDLELTEKIVAACATMQIRVHDHLIFTDESWLSFSQLDVI